MFRLRTVLFKPKVLPFPQGFMKTESDGTKKIHSVSQWKWPHCEEIVDFEYDPNLFGPKQWDLLSPKDKVFCGCDIKLQKPTQLRPFWKTSCNVQNSVNHELMKYLLEKFGANAMRGISIDPATNLFQFPKNPHCTRDEDREMNRIHGVFNSEVKEAVENTIVALGDARNEEPKERDVKEPNIDALSFKWLQMCGFDSKQKGVKLSGNVKQSFRFAGQSNVAAIPDCIVVETKSNDIVLIVEDKAGHWTANNGHLAQVFGEALCCLWHNQGNKRSRHPNNMYAIRMTNYFPCFFKLEATHAQLDAVCNKKKLPKSFAKMKLVSDTEFPMRKMSSTVDYLGWSLINKHSRKEAQWRMAKLRAFLL